MLSRIFHPGSSRPFSIQGIGPSLPPFHMRHRRLGSPGRAHQMQSRSPLTHWASRWGSWAASQRCKTLGVFHCWPPCPTGIGRRSSRSDMWVGPWSTLWRTQCTRSLTWTGMGRRRPRAAGSWWPSWRSCILCTPVSVPCVFGGISSPPWVPSIPGRVPFGQGRAVGQRKFRILVHIIRAGGRGRGSHSGLRQGCTRRMPHSP